MSAPLNKIPRYVAIHEAGHAVACWYTGTIFDRAVVRTLAEQRKMPYIDGRGRSRHLSGIVEVPDRFSTFPGLDADTPIRRRNAEIDTIISYAGPVAESRYSRVSEITIFLTGGADDYAQALTKIRALTNNDHEAEMMSDRLIRQTRSILRDPGIWESVKAVASALQKKRSLEWDETLSIIQKETGEGQRPYSYMLPT